MVQHPQSPDEHPDSPPPPPEYPFVHPSERPTDHQWKVRQSSPIATLVRYRSKPRRSNRSDAQLRGIP